MFQKRGFCNNEGSELEVSGALFEWAYEDDGSRDDPEGRLKKSQSTTWLEINPLAPGLDHRRWMRSTTPRNLNADAPTADNNSSPSSNVVGRAAPTVRSKGRPLPLSVSYRPT